MATRLRATELPVYIPEYNSPKCLNYYSYVQKVSPTLVAKFASKWEDCVGNEQLELSALEKLANEYTLLEDVYGAGLNVPKPEGLYLVPKIKRSFFAQLFKIKLDTPAILMQYIDGITLEEMGVTPMDEEMISEAYKLHEEERKKAESLGFDPYDFGVPNAIYCQSERKVYLVDLEFWGKVKP